MDPALEIKIYSHVQSVARHFLAFRGSIESIVTFIVYDMGTDAPDPDQLALFLRKEEHQRILQLNWETGLWRATDKTYRLVCLATPTDANIARRRLENYPTSPTQCRWCWIDEKGLSNLELRPELDIYRNPYSKSFVHPNCTHAWALTRALAERAESESG